MQSSLESKKDPGSLDELFSDSAVASQVKEVSPSSYDTVSEFWRAPLAAQHLTLRMKELILLAMHASAAALTPSQVKRHVDRALAAGASKEDIVDVLVSVIGLANHSLYASVPILEEELKAAGKTSDTTPPWTPKLEAAKQKFVEIRGFWNPDRDAVARLIPDYFAALTNLSTESWKNGTLARKEREFICIGIDCSVAHTYEAGLRIHIRNALKCGATQAEILEIFTLAALMGVDTYVMGAEAMFQPSKR